MTAPLKPPAAWFDQPEPDHPEPLTVEADGRVHGHLAPWAGCHSGLVNGSGSSCVRPPKSITDYRMFHLGSLETAEGGSVPVGKIVVGGSHAGMDDSLAAATAHYDKTGSVAAFVRARNGKHGIFLSGALKSDVTPEQRRDLSVNPPSGDWRLLEHNLELVGALAVPVPGFGIPALVASTDAGEMKTVILTGFEREVTRMEGERITDAGYVLEKRLLTDSLDEPAYLDVGLTAAVFSAEQRARLAKTGAAMPDGSFPIRNCSDWDNARRAIGRANPSKRAAVERHIAKRGRALGCGGDD